MRRNSGYSVPGLSSYPWRRNSASTHWPCKRPASRVMQDMGLPESKEDLTFQIFHLASCSFTTADIGQRNIPEFHVFGFAWPLCRFRMGRGTRARCGSSGTKNCCLSKRAPLTSLLMRPASQAKSELENCARLRVYRNTMRSVSLAQPSLNVITSR